MKSFLKIFSITFFFIGLEVSANKKCDCLNELETLQLIKKVLNEKDSELWLNNQIKKKKEILLFKRKLMVNDFSQNNNMLSKINYKPLFLQESYCDFMLNEDKTDLDIDIKKNKRTILYKCAEIYEKINNNKAINTYLDIYYNYSNENNVKILKILKGLYLKVGNMEKYEQLKEVLKEK